MTDKRRQPHSEEHKRRIAESVKKSWTPEHREKVVAALKGRPLSAEHRAKTGEARRGKKNSPEHVQKVADALRGRKRDPEMIARGIAKRSELYAADPERRARRKEAMAKLTSLPEYRERQRENTKRAYREGRMGNLTVSAVELSLAPILEPLGYRHTGDGGKFIHGPGGIVHVPDWTNDDDQKLVEVWGDYWHRGENPQDLIDWYALAGWICVVIWEHDVIQIISGDVASRW